MLEPINIITPVYNAEKTLLRTYESVKRQTVKNWYWIIIDDGSSDGSFDLFEKLSRADGRLTVIKNLGKKGAGGARNFGLKEVKSGLITFIDADDCWRENFLEVMLPFVEKPNSIAFSGYERKSYNKIKSFVPSNIVTFENLFRGSDISCLTALYHFAKIEDIPEFGEIRARNDLVFNLRALQAIPYAVPVEKVLATYNISEGSVSSNKLKLIFWQYFVSRMFDRSPITSIVDVFCWMVYGVRKYM